MGPEQGQLVGAEARAPEWIAIIDDDEFVRQSLTRFFKILGISAQSYEAADEYAGRAFGQLPACIVLDLQLHTGMSSFEFIDWLEVEGQRVPIIFMTGQAELKPDLCERYPELRETLRKPFDPDCLLARVRFYLKASSSTGRSTLTTL
jgi:FixJ family two-component response regulator